MHESDSPSGALETTIGPIVTESDAATLQPCDRARIIAWRDARWTSLEERASVLGPRDAHAWYEMLSFERWRSHHSAGGLSAPVLDLFYRAKPLIPRRMQLALRRRLIKRQGAPTFPAWPLETAGSDLLRIALADALLELGSSTARFPWFWPDGAEAAVTLTHDVESAAGLANAPEVAAWEEGRRLRSSFNVVMHQYPLDMRQLSCLVERGHEVGSHALWHDRSLFASRASFERQLPLLREAAKQLGAVGFRAPATHRVIEWLAELPFSYDCTMPHSDPYEPIPGGTATLWPFFHGDVVELPYTAPQDHTLYNLLGHRDAALWCRQLQTIIAHKGMFQIVTHPDSEYLGRELTGAAYRELLDAAATRTDVWVALPRDVADWWRRRAAGLTPRDDGIASWTGSAIELAPAESRAARSRAS